MFPLLFDCSARDVLLVLLSPLARQGTPRTVGEIGTRSVELAFSTHFMREMRMFAQAIALASPGLLASGRLERRLRAMRFHLVDADADADADGLASLQRSDTRMLAHGPFLRVLFAQGRERGQAWLSAHFDGVGRRSTVDVARWFG